MAASGVRSSCETPESSVLRRNSASTRSHACRGFLGQRRPLDGQRGLRGERLDQLPLLGGPARRRRPADQTPARPRVPREPFSGTYVPVGGGQRGRAAAGGLVVLEGPLRDAELLVVERRRRRRCRP